MVFAPLVLAALASSSTVYIMRHCSRSTYSPDLEHAPHGLRHLANYSDGGPLPSWGVAPTLCTARGARIVAGQGRSMADEVRAQSEGFRALKVVYDGSAERDNTTARAFLDGLGLPASLARPDTAVFNPAKAGLCPYPSKAEYVAAIRERLRSASAPARLPGLLEKLQASLGRGVAPPIPQTPNRVSPDGYWLGGVYVSGAWAEAMLLQYGAGLPVAYGRVDPAALYALLELHIYYRSINSRGWVISQRSSSNALAHALSDLHANESREAEGLVEVENVEGEAFDATRAESPSGEPAGSIASVYVGHDTQLDGLAVLLNLTWSAPPYPRDATPPGAMLRFRRTGSGDDARVEASFLYTTFGDELGTMRVANATFGASGAHTISLAQFTAAATAAIDWSCVGHKLAPHAS